MAEATQAQLDDVIAKARSGKDFDPIVIEHTENVDTLLSAAVINTFMEKKLDTPIAYSFQYRKWNNEVAAKASDEWPSDKEVFKGLNQDLERGSKAKAYQASTVKMRETYETTDEYATKSLIASIVAAGKTEAEAEGLAQSILGTRYKK